MGMIELQMAPPARSPLHLPVFSPTSALAGLTSEEPALRFGDFTLFPRKRELLFRDAPVKLGSRAFDVLTKLVTSEGKIVSKAELIDHVWPSIFVDESNLRFQMATLRKVLGDARNMIKTIPGRGYLFVESAASQGGPLGGRVGPAPPSRAPSGRLSNVMSLVPDAPVAKDTRFTVLLIEGDGPLRELLGKVLQSLDQDNGA